MSQITTHVLDTASGSPAEGVPIALQEWKGKQWQTIAQGTTNSDGRISDLLDNDSVIAKSLWLYYLSGKLSI